MKRKNLNLVIFAQWSHKFINKVMMGNKLLFFVCFLSYSLVGQVNPKTNLVQLKKTQKEITVADSLVNKDQLEVAKGDFKPTWASLNTRKFPDWFRNAKFGIWAHWGPQSEACGGDWYAHKLYYEGSELYKFHLKKYGHPSEIGFKDIINDWKAEKFDAEKLTALYKKAGARYIVSMAVHHDNFDNWNSKYQPWNSVNMGPKRDIVGEWKKAAENEGLRFGVSIHNINSWGWYDPSRGADTSGVKKGIRYDGCISQADGKGKWWEGYDPTDLYGPMHKGGANGDRPTAAFIKNWFLRTKELIDKYQPDLLEFDLWSPNNIWRQWVRFEEGADNKTPDQRVGMLIAQHYFNQERKWHHGKDEGILTLKGIDAIKRGSITEVYETDFSKTILPDTWEMEEGMGNWHYDGEGKSYYSAQKVVAMLTETVCRNGNLLLNVVLRPDGTIAGDQEQTLLKVGKWLNVNGEAIYDSRPFTVMGEGPNRIKTRSERKEESQINVMPKYTQEDIRFTTNNNAIYAIVMVQPTKQLLVKSLAGMNIESVNLLGCKRKIDWKQTHEGLEIQASSKSNLETDLAVVYKIKVKR